MYSYNRTIYQLLDSRGAGGIETHVLTLSRWFHKNGIKNEVLFVKDYGPNPLKDKLNKEHIPWRSLADTSALYSLVKREPALLATHGYKAGIIGRLIALITGTPVVSTFHSGDLGTGKLRLYTLFDNLSAILADKVMSVSPEISKRLTCDPVQIANFVDAHQVKPTQGDQIAFVGRLSEEKGPDSFARITNMLKEKSNCHVYGDGPLFNKLAQHTHLHMHGQVDMQDHWHKIGLLCITSQHEGLPLVALEAMARGIPVASYAVGALPELISQPYTGWLIQPKDEKNFHQAIETWMSLDISQKQAMSSFSRKHIVRYYASDVICPKIIKVYQAASCKKDEALLLAKPHR